MFESLLPLLQVVADNVTQALPTINIPATLTPTFTPPTASAATAFSPSDPLSYIGLFGGLLAAWNTYQQRKTNGQTNALANAQLDIVSSLKNTDVGVRDLSMGVDAGFKKLAQNETNAELLNSQTGELKGETVLNWIKHQKEGWDQSIKDYYQNMQPVQESFNKDPVIAKTGLVKTQTEPAKN